MIYVYRILRFALKSIFLGHQTLDIKRKSIESDMRNEMKSLCANQLAVLVLFRYSLYSTNVCFGK